jgi:SHS2 domain-containing protein
MTGEIRWEHFPHESDIGVRGYGRSVEEAFKMAALALTAVVSLPEKIKPTNKVRVSCTAPDLEILFNDWLNAIIYEMDTRNMLFSEFLIAINTYHLEAVLLGEALDIAKHQPTVYVKGATFTELLVEKQKDLWVAQCVVDV